MATGVCTDHNCAAGQKCVTDDNGGYTCMTAYCDDLLPDIYKAVSIETFGLYKNLGTGNKFKCNEGFALVGRPFAVCTDYGEWKILFCCIEQALYPPHGCAEIPSRCGSGVYRIHPTTSAKFDVYCEMDTDNGGWTVIQRRLDGSTDFYRGWTAYEDGFGNLTHEFWLGNAKIHKIVSSGDYQLRVDLEDFEGNAFLLLRNSDDGDSLSYHTGNMFSTHDRDNDKYPTSCAVNFKGAWWYQNCHLSNLNGAYLSGGMGSYADGVIWKKWKGYYYSLKSTKLMIKKL
ncbi:microfibril-associated glycoprotein 4-like [Mytilus californianus]|uniref:microfibril-associated glycoprotein 4-like n=1 Tax=Mytilus californianus TaxID=6549 RepID=UPI0022456895|nr:microfibril-associated glycoprotein 4-like [Mytilus californianus]